MRSSRSLFVLVLVVSGCGGRDDRDQALEVNRVMETWRRVCVEAPRDSAAIQSAFQDAEIVLLEATESCPDSARFLQELGHLYLGAGRLEDSEHVYKRLWFECRYVDAAKRLSGIYTRQQNWEASVRANRAILAIDETDETARQNVLRALHMLGRDGVSEEGIERFQAPFPAYPAERREPRFLGSPLLDSPLRPPPSPGDVMTRGQREERNG